MNTLGAIEYRMVRKKKSGGGERGEDAGDGREFVEGEDNLVCPNCGSLELGVPPTSVDVFSTYADVNKFYCRRCGFEGIPFYISEKSAYDTFLKVRRGELRIEDLEEGVKPEAESEAELEPLPSQSIVDKTPRRISSGGLAVWSYLIPGAGQAKLGYRRRGWMFFLLVFLSPFAAAVLYPIYPCAVTKSFFYCPPISYFLSIADAYILSKRGKKSS